nr:Rib/alpha-like domain-containing protein [Limosilactobacillus reuteri]
MTIHVADDTPTTVTPEGQDQTVTKGEQPKAGDSIANKDDLPEGTTYTWKETPDTKTTGDHTATVVVTYPGGSSTEVTVTIHVMDDTPTTVTPEGQDQTVTKGEQPNAGNSIANKDDLPEGTTYTWKETPDTTTPGDHTATVVVTYPDGTQVEVAVTLHVDEPAVAAGTNATGQTTTKQVAQTNGNNGNQTTTDQATTQRLPQTGNQTNGWAALTGALGLSLLGLFGIGKKRKHD